MKTFTLSKKDLAYLTPLDSILSGINVAIQVYVVGTVFKRLGIESTARARYDTEKGELYVEEKKDAEASAMGVKATEAPKKEPKE